MQIEELFQTAQNAALSEDERTTAVHALGRFPAEQAIPYLIRLLKEDSLAVRWAAATTLRKYGRAMLPALLRALATQPADHNFYESAHRALVRFGDPEIEAILAPVLKALEEPGGEATAPAAALQALETLEGSS